MLTKRIVACLDVAGGRTVKGTRFTGLRDAGDPVALAARYEDDGADEIVVLDIAAAPEGRGTLLALLERIALRLAVPVTVGGGVRTAEDVGAALRSGADRVAINSAAVARPEVLEESAERFGRQCVVASIDARAAGGGWRVVTHGGRRDSGLEAVAWARECARRGAGEVLLTSIDRDGGRAGYDLALTRAVSEAVSVPVVASGGAGSVADVLAALTRGRADAALVAGILHDGTTTIRAIKAALAREGVPVREPDGGARAGAAAPRGGAFATARPSEAPPDLRGAA